MSEIEIAKGKTLPKCFRGTPDMIRDTLDTIAKWYWSFDHRSFDHFGFAHAVLDIAVDAPPRIPLIFEQNGPLTDSEIAACWPGLYCITDVSKKRRQLNEFARAVERLAVERIQTGLADMFREAMRWAVCDAGELGSDERDAKACEFAASAFGV